MPRLRIEGHEAQRRAFAKANASGRLAHAYLFAGPPGIGKRPFAFELAAALLCENAGPELVACDRCSSCRLMDAGNHPDFFSVTRPEDKNELPIDVMRELCRDFSLKPARGHGKVAVVEDADDLNAESANCFLKTLEEPPPHSVFFLIGTTPERQLPTVISRCQLIRFAPLPDETVARILQQNGVADSAMVARLVHLGQGSPGIALGLADPDLWAFRKELVAGLLQPRPDSVALSKQLLEFVQAAGKEGAVQRRRASQVLRLLIALFDDALAASLGATSRQGDVNEMARLRKLADRVGPDVLLQILERCLEADVQIRRFVQLVLVLEGLFDALGVMLTTK